MQLRRWLLLFFAVVLCFAALWLACNLLVDPFGVFGDRLMHWYAYDMTMNPRVAKIEYLDRHFDQYDSYVLGSSKASSLPVDALDGYLDAHFYNMTWYGGDLLDMVQALRYLTEHGTVKNIVLALDPQETTNYNSEDDPIKGNMHWKLDGSSPAAFYAKYVFANPSYSMDKISAWFQRGYLMDENAVYVEETGCYNKQRRDAVRIGGMAEYLAAENNLLETEPADMADLDEALGALREIKAICDEGGIRLIVVGVPLYEDDFNRYPQEGMAAFWKGAAEITDIYDFWGYHSICGDLRYFYDTNHFRNDVGRMMLARIFGDESRWVPEGFGQLTTAENAEARIAEAYAAAESEPYAAVVPVLMYHSFTEDAENTDWAVLQTEDFRDQLEALRGEGYESVTFAQLRDYVDHGTALPEKPIVITMDDGYRDNLTLAAPMLEEFGFCAAEAVIGVSVGCDTYKDTGEAMIPHFALEEILPWAEKGVFTLTTHSYDMHQSEELDGAHCRHGALRLPGESEAAFVQALTEDYRLACAQLQTVPGADCSVYVYPFGFSDLLSEVVLQSLGVRATVTTEAGVNEILKGLPQSLVQLHRTDVHNGMDGEALLKQLELETKSLQQDGGQ